MARIATKYKRELGELLAKGHARYGHVSRRMPYYEDDEGGTGSAGLRFETHPLLANLPDGAASDLTNIVPDRKNIVEITQDRAEEACPELQMQPIIQQGLSHGHAAIPTRY